MEIVNIEGISFPVAKYKIVCFENYGEPHEDEIYLPLDVKLYKYDDYESNIDFNGVTYSQQSYFGITEWSEEKERIAQNMRCEIPGEENNPPVINSLAFESYNLFNKYLIYVLKNAAPYNEENFPLTDVFPTIPETLYVKRVKIDNEVFQELTKLMYKKGKISKEEKEKIENLKSRLFRPIQYIKINGFESGENFDATVVDVYSIILNRNKEIHSISRKKYDIKLLCLGDVNYKTKFKEIEKKEYDDLFQKMITLF